MANWAFPMYRTIFLFVAEINSNLKLATCVTVSRNELEQILSPIWTFAGWYHRSNCFIRFVFFSLYCDENRQFFFICGILLLTVTYTHSIIQQFTRCVLMGKLFWVHVWLNVSIASVVINDHNHVPHFLLLGLVLLIRYNMILCLYFIVPK